MANVKSDISLIIKNNLNRNATFSILGGTQDPSNGQANARTLYEWDLSAETFANTTVLTIQASTVTNPTVITYEVSNQDGAITDLETVVRLLNTLNLGVFNLDGNVVWILDDINVFGDIDILVSLTFDINVFTTQAYDYFDANGHTSFAQFSTRYQSSIQQAVNTVPNFVANIDSLGWGMCYPLNGDINMQRTNTGDVYVMTDAPDTTVYGGTSNVTQLGFNYGLVYVSDLSIFQNMTSMRLIAKNGVQNNLFKIAFDSTSIEFQFSAGFNGGWTLLDPTYINPINDNNALEIYVPNDATPEPQFDPYATGFPLLSVGAGGNGFVEILSSPPFGVPRIDLQGIGLPVGGSVDFGTLGQNSRMLLANLGNTFGNVLNLDFSTLTLIGDGQELEITADETNAFPIEIFIFGGFQDKFTYNADEEANFLSIGGTLGLSNSPTIEYTGATPTLELYCENISFANSMTINIPDIATGGGFMGKFRNFPRTFTLNLNLTRQEPLPAINSMSYFNKWYYEFGTQPIYEQALNGVGTIDTGSGNSFVLSGNGLYGYFQSDAFQTSITPVGAITPSLFSFTQENVDVFIRTTTGGGQSNFQVTSAEEGNGSVEDVDNSTFFALNTETLTLALPITNPIRNAIFTLDPTIACTNLYIGSNPPFTFTDALTTFYIGNGIYGSDLGSLTISGLTLNLPVQLDAQVRAIGLYKRDFSGIDSTVAESITFDKFTLNSTQIVDSNLDPSKYPFGSNKVFNFDTANPPLDVTFSNCDFHSLGETDTSFLPQPLSTLFEEDLVLVDGIEFFGCSFNYGNPPLLPSIRFNVNDNNGSQIALLGDSFITDTTFLGSGGTDNIELFTNYNGLGNSFNSITFTGNSQLNSVNLINNSTAVPPASTVTFFNNNNLTTINLQDYNITNLALTSALPLCSNFRCNDNNLPSADLDDIIITLDNNGLTGGTLDYANQTGGASPNIGVSGTAYNNLIVKGWTVTGNVPS